MFCSQCNTSYDLPAHKHLLGCPNDPDSLDASTLVQTARSELAQIKSIPDNSFRRHAYALWAITWAERLINKVEQLHQGY